METLKGILLSLSLVVLCTACPLPEGDDEPDEPDAAGCGAADANPAAADANPVADATPPDAGPADAGPCGLEGGRCCPAYENDGGITIEARCGNDLNCDVVPAGGDICTQCGDPGEPCCRVGTGLFCHTSSCSNFTGLCL